MGDQKAGRLAADIHDGNVTVECGDLEREEYYVDGERLTEERAEQMAAEVLDEVRARNLVPGGKSLSGGTTHSPAVQVVVSEVTATKLKQIARARNMSVSRMLRPVLDEFVERETHAG